MLILLTYLGYGQNDESIQMREHVESVALLPAG